MRTRCVVYRRIASAASYGAALILGAVLSASPVAAVGGFDTTGCYLFSDSLAPIDANAPTFSFVDIAPTGTRLYLDDDQVSGAIPIGFTFHFYGVPRTGVYVSSNGFITFVAPQNSACCQGDPIPTATSPALPAA